MDANSNEITKTEAEMAHDAKRASNWEAIVAASNDQGGLPSLEQDTLVSIAWLLKDTKLTNGEDVQAYIFGNEEEGEAGKVETFAPCLLPTQLQDQVRDRLFGDENGKNAVRLFNEIIRLELQMNFDGTDMGGEDRIPTYGYIESINRPASEKAPEYVPTGHEKSDTAIPSGLSNNGQKIKHEAYAGVVKMAKGEQVPDFDQIMSQHGYTPKNSSKLVQAARIVNDITLETSPTKTLMGGEMKMPELEYKIERAVKHHMANHSPEESLEKTALMLLAATEAQISAEVIVDIAMNIRYDRNEAQLVSGTANDDDAPILFNIAHSISSKGSETDYSDMKNQATCNTNYMSRRAADDLCDDIGRGADLSGEQRNIVAKRAATVEAAPIRQKEQAAISAIQTHAREEWR